jgi:hypothetical protein
VKIEEDLVRAIVNYRICKLATKLQLLVVTICTCSVNPDPVYSHILSRDNISYC